MISMAFALVSMVVALVSMVLALVSLVLALVPCIGPGPKGPALWARPKRGRASCASVPISPD